MLEVHPSARRYLANIVADHGQDNLGVRITVSQPGTPAADCALDFCDVSTLALGDRVIELAGLTVVIEAASKDWLDDAEIDFETDRGGGQIVVKAPNIKGSAPGPDASLQARAQHVIDTELNPAVASHGGRISIDRVDDDGKLFLVFGGGCQGCGAAGQTLKNMVEKTLFERLDDLRDVIDATEHEKGENPYIQ